MNKASDPSRALHVAVVCPGCDLGGSVGNVAVRQAIELARCFSVTLVSDVCAGFAVPNVHVAPVSPRQYNFLHRFCHVPNNLAFVNAVAKRLEQRHSQAPIDLVIFHGHSTAAFAGHRFKRRHGVPCALVTHGDIFHRPRGMYDPWMTAFYKVVTRPAYRTADLVLALSPYMADCAIAGGASPDRVKIVPNGLEPCEIGLDLNLASTTPAEGVAGPLKLLYVGRFSVEKGIQVLIDSCVAMSEQGLDFQLSAVGGGPLEESVRGVLRGHPQVPVYLLGPQHRRSLAQRYQEADVVCVPSLDEACALVPLDALMCGRPVIASNVGGIRATVRDGENGLLVAPGDPRALASAIARLAGDRQLLAALAARAQPSVYPGLSWESIGLRLRDVIEDYFALKSPSAAACQVSTAN